MSLIYKENKNKLPENILMYKDFIGSVVFSAADNVFHGKIEGIDDLVTFEGESVSELNKSFKEAVNDYIETCKLVNKPLFKSYKGSFNVRISQELHAKAARLANILNISLNKFVQNALESEVNKNAGMF